MKRIFLIDDEEMSNYINEWTLRNVGFFDQIDVYESASLALKSLQEMAECHIEGPEYILLDICMPLMNGYEFLDEFGKLPEYFTKDIRIIMLTTSLNSYDRARSLEYKEVSGFFNKPLTEEVVMRNLKFPDENRDASIIYG